VLLKNIHPLLGRPLIAHVAPVIANVSHIDRAVVSTDDPAITDAARSAGLDVPFVRPGTLARDTTGDHEVLVHALQETERVFGDRYDVIVMLQPTSPLRKARHVKATIEKLVDEGWDAVWTLTLTDAKYHPVKQLTIDDQGQMRPYDGEFRVMIRQELSTVYHRNGAAYAFTRECLLEHGSIFGRSSAALVIDEPMVSIDTLEDFAEVEERLHSRQP